MEGEEDNLLGVIYEDVSDYDIDSDEAEVDQGDVDEKDQGEEKDVGKKGTRRQRKGNKKTKRIANFNVDSYVANVCKELKEKKLFMVYNTIDCLGKAGFDKLVEQVRAIQAEGGQKTAAGDRLKSGGGILWKMLKEEHQAVYNHVMMRQMQLKRCEEAM